MRKRSFLLYMLTAFGCGQMFAQQSINYTHADTDFDRAVALFREEQFAAAQNLFDQVNDREISQEMQADCAYYIAFCAVSLDQDGAEEKVKQFVENHPTSAKQPQAYLAISNFYFRQGDYQEALNYANRVNEDMLSEKNREQLIFHKAYAYFENKNYAFKTLQAAIEGGAELICLCETKGGFMMDQVATAVKDVVQTFGNKVEVGIHTHNDCGLAVANSLVAVSNGVTHVQGVLLGFGEQYQLC